MVFAAAHSILVSDEHNEMSFVERCVYVAREAIEEAGIAGIDPQTLLVLSTTKGDNLDLWTPALQIAQALGCTHRPIVVSNACTSGVCAQITAARLLATGPYKYAVVIGCDILTDFIRSGFEALKALSPEPCRPFDSDRQGLNLGEATACLIMARGEEAAGHWVYEAGSIHNDANHITGPSRTGEGSYRCLRDVLPTEIADLACLSLHGTGTPYNDEMESIAVHRAGLDSVPIVSLKGYYGHTLGAAGLLETIVTMRHLDSGLIPAAKGYQHQGTTYALNISAERRTTDKRHFIKLLSGFGGVNAAVRWRKQ